MPAYQIEMHWVCSTCKYKNLGRHKKCKGCGKHLEHEQFLMPDDQSQDAEVKDENLLADAKAGEDWCCRYCLSSQKKLDGSCANCGADQEEKFFVDLDKEIDTKPKPNREELEYGHVKFRRVTEEDDEDTYHLPNKISQGTIIGVGIACGVLLLSVALYFIFRTKMYDVTVDSVQWTHTVHIDRYQTWHKEGFYVPPGAINIQPLGQRIHHYDHNLDHYNTINYTVQVADGQNCTTIPRSCYTTSRTCTSNKNGYASCSGGDQVCSGGGQSCTTKYRSENRTKQEPVYREDPIYQPYYAYLVWDWGHNRDAVKGGYNLSTVWPNSEDIHLGLNLNAGEQEREAGRESSYIVNFVSKDRTFDYKAKTEAEFQLFPKGSLHRIKHSIGGGVEIWDGRK